VLNISRLGPTECMVHIFILGHNKTSGTVVIHIVMHTQLNSGIEWSSRDCGSWCPCQWMDPRLRNGCLDLSAPNFICSIMRPIKQYAKQKRTCAGKIPLSNIRPEGFRTIYWVCWTWTWACLMSGQYPGSSRPETMQNVCALEMHSQHNIKIK
jgi:hypothetical protein